jgi:hypothetical protein
MSKYEGYMYTILAIAKHVLSVTLHSAFLYGPETVTVETTKKIREKAL